jgi:rhomboid protease GluP
MTLDPPLTEDAEELPGYVPPDPDEPPPFELWPTLADIRPWVTLALVLAWGLWFGLLAMRGALADPRLLLVWGGSATGLGSAESSWRLLASTFLHAGAAHVFFNALSMVLYGPAVERIFTRWGFIIVFVVGGAAASLASLIWRSARIDGLSVSVGASGTIFALGGSLLAAAVRLRRRLAPGRARALGGAFLFLLVQGFVAGVTRHGTDNVAHAAGLAAGILIGAAIPLHPRLGGSEPGIARRGLATLLAALLGLSMALAIRSGLASA